MSTGTREKIQSTAELLFAEDGFDCVTLRQIARAAGQRNVAAVQYHFGSKDELLKAIVVYHREQLDERRQELLGLHERTNPEDELAALLHLLIGPLAEKLDSASGRAYLRIQAAGLGELEMRPATRSLFQRIGQEIVASQATESKTPPSLRDRKPRPRNTAATSPYSCFSTHSRTMRASTRRRSPHPLIAQSLSKRSRVR